MENLSPAMSDSMHHNHNPSMHVQSQGFGAVVQQPAALPIPVQGGVPTISRQDSHHSLANLPRLRPVFGVPLDYLLTRDDSAIPTVVYQCIRAVDLYGLDVEGIYRVSGERRHVERIKAIFDNGKLHSPKQ
jgi:hypothetical protein